MKKFLIYTTLQDRTWKAFGPGVTEEDYKQSLDKGVISFVDSNNDYPNIKFDKLILVQEI